MSLKWSSNVASKPDALQISSPSQKMRAQKHKTDDFRLKIAIRLKKVCYKVFLCENCQRQSCKTFIGLTILAKSIFRRRPLLPEILDQTDRVGAKSPIFELFSLLATEP